MKTRSRNMSLSHADDPRATATDQEGASGSQSYGDLDDDVKRSNTTGRKVTEGLKKRIGGLRRRRE